jgi:hypothetical protein
MARTLQAELDQIAEHADATTRKGLHYILTEACLALLRHPDYCTSGLCKCDVTDTQNDTEEQFNQLSLEERGKFDEETLVNFNSLRRHVMAGSKGTQFHNEYIVVRSSAPCSYNSYYMQGHLSLSLGLSVLHPIWVIAYLQKVMTSTVSQVPSLSLLFGVSLHLDANSISAISFPPVPLTRGFSYMAGDNPGGCRRRA